MTNKHPGGLEDHIRIVHDITPADWDKAPLTLAGELRELMATLKDEDTSIDCGTGNGEADLFVIVGGIEYRVTVQRSHYQKKQDKLAG